MQYQCEIRNFFSEKKEKDRDIYIVVSLDILGFSNYILKNYDIRRHEEKINVILSYFSSLGESDYGDKTYHCAIFSDCVFLFLKVTFDSYILHELKAMLIDMTKAIQLAMQRGFLVRGGICVGECVVNFEKNIFYGPGIIKAHFLESKQAKSARLIMDDFDYNQLLSLFKYTSNWSEDDIKKSMRFIRHDEYYCFDFLEQMFQLSGKRTGFYEYMQRHKALIEYCQRIIMNDDTPDKEKHLSKLDFHISSYEEALNIFSSEDIKKLRLEQK